MQKSTLHIYQGKLFLPRMNTEFLKGIRRCYGRNIVNTLIEHKLALYFLTLHFENIRYVLIKITSDPYFSSFALMTDENL